MSDVNSLFKKKKGKSKALDLNAATTKKPTKTKAEKQKEAAEDEEWKTETKKTVVMTNGKAVEEFGKKYTQDEEVVYEEDLDMGTKIDIDDTRKMLQDVIQRSTLADAAPEKEEKEKVEEPPAPVKSTLSSLSLEDRFARASSSSKYVARGGSSGFGSGSGPPKKSLEEEYPTLGMSVAKSAPAPQQKKIPKPSKPKAEQEEVTVQETVQETAPETVFRAAPEVQKKEDTPPAPVVSVEPEVKVEVTPTVLPDATVSSEPSSKIEETPAVKKDKKKKKKGGAFEI